LLFAYKAWANRLLSKSTFTEIIDRLERVGSKREIQVTLHRLRNGIWPPYTSTEQVQSSGSENEDEPVGLQATSQNLNNTADEDEESAWERALRAMPVQKNEVTVTGLFPTLWTYPYGQLLLCTLSFLFAIIFFRTLYN
uniref:Swi3 domain-containing protein n=1 Tax=Echinostoma caproni TaxID=27848 RepID=A0A183A368_9TREM